MTSNASKKGQDIPAPGKEEMEIFKKAEEILNGNRQGQYGKPERNLSDIANVWNWYLNARKSGQSAGLDAKDVGIMMALLKIVRAASGYYKDDNYVDAINYLALAEEFERMLVDG